MFGGRIKIERSLLERCRKVACDGGYASLEEFVAHALERELDRQEEDRGNAEQVRQRLQGLGYIS